MSDLQSVVVTGAASGIGAAAAKILKSTGVNVIGVDVNTPSEGSVDHFIKMDQGDFSSIESAVAKIPNKPDGLLNIAGVAPSQTNTPSKVLMINFYGLRHFTELMYEKLNTGASIVNLSSGTGLGWSQNISLLKEALTLNDYDSVEKYCNSHNIHNQGIVNDASYPLSKQLLIVWTAHAHLLWKEHGFRMNAVAPAAVDTPILDDFLDSFGDDARKRMEALGAVSADEVAQIAVMLLNSKYKWVNGTTIPVERGVLQLKGITQHFELS